MFKESPFFEIRECLVAGMILQRKSHNLPN